MSKELFSQIIAPLNKGVNQQADSLMLPGFAKSLENGVCDLVEGLKKRLGSVPLKRIDTLTKNAGGLTLVNPIKWDEAWLFVYNRSSAERFILIAADDSRTVSRTGNITNGSAVIQSVSSMTDIFVGVEITGTGIPSGTVITDIDVAGSRITLSKNATATTTGVTLTVESNYTFVTGISNIEPISGVLPEVVPVEQTFSGITSTNLGYLRGAGRARDRFRATSFQDYVFVTNTQKIVSYDATETLTRYNISNISGTYRPTKAQVIVKAVDYDTEYAITITLDNNDVIRGHYISPSLTSDSGATNIVNTEQIASSLVSKTQTITGVTTSGSNVVTGVNTNDIETVAVQERAILAGVIPTNSFIGAITVGTTMTRTGTTTNNSNVITSVSSMTDIYIGATVTGTNIPALARITAFNTGASTITLDKNATATGSGISLTIEANSSFTLVNEAGAAANALASGGTASAQTITIGDGLTEGDINNELNYSVKNSQILIGLNSASRYFKSFVVHDARGDTLMSGFTNQVTSITELPNTSWEGYTVLVAPTGAADQSSYYLQFNAENTTTNGDYGRGVWEETSGWGTPGLLDKTTMPHSFIYYKNSSGLTRFTFQPFTGASYTDGSISLNIPGWTTRLAGDADELPGPTFVDHSINDIVFFKNRLGFVSGENVILSQAADYFNFWQQSAVQVVDSDTIDLTAISNDVATLNYALQQQDELVLFSSENQFRLYSGDNVTFSPDTASVGRISSISMEANVKPQQIGPQVLFPVKEGDFTGFQTFITTDRTVGINLGQTAVITETVPRYIPKNIDSLAVSRTDQFLITLSSDDPNSLYVYQFFWEASGGSLTNRQNAWHKWIFPNKSIYWCDFVEGTLMQLTKYVNGANNEYYLEGLNVSRPPQNTNELFLLDRQISSSITTDLGSATFSYSAATNRTTVTLPYKTVNPSQFVVIKQDAADNNETKKRWIVSNNIPAGVTSFVCDSLGDFTDSSWVFGEQFTFTFQPPVLMPLSRAATENTFVGNRTGRLQLRYVDFYYNESRYFKVEVTPKFRDTTTYEFDRRDLLNSNIVIGEEEEFEQAKFRAHIFSKNDQVTVELVNDSIDQAKFIAMEWTGLYFDVARKYG